MKKYKTFIEAMSLTLVFPSQSAFDIYKESLIKIKGEHVIFPHILLKMINTKPTNSKISKKTHIKIAFCGEPVSQKGFKHFLELSRLTISNENLSFYHFGRYSSGYPHIKFVKTTLDGCDSQMKRNILEYEIDLVFMGSYWPETFNYVAYEALEGNAALLTHEDSGNISALVHSTGVGFEYKSIDDCVARICDPKNFINHLYHARENIKRIKQDKNTSYIFSKSAT